MLPTGVLLPFSRQLRKAIGLCLVLAREKTKIYLQKIAQLAQLFSGQRKASENASLAVGKGRIRTNSAPIDEVAE